MAKTWDQLTDPEKIEELRRDLTNTMARVNQLDRFSDLLSNGISDLVRRVGSLERRAEEADKSPKALEKSDKSVSKKRKS